MKRNILTFLIFIFSSILMVAQNYNVKSISETFYDGNRANRSVNTRIYYPDTSTSLEEFPVVVLGHGFVMGYDAYQNIYDKLVPNGYIVVFVNTEGSFFANHDAYSKDLAFIVNRIGDENINSSSPLYGIVGEARALLGHSLGGGAAIVAASLTNVETLVALAPAVLRIDTETPAQAVSAESIVFSGSSDDVTSPDSNHVPLYDNLGSSCKYFISITGGGHCYYANSNGACDFGEFFSLGNVSVTRNEQQEIMFRFLLPWFNYKLKGDLSSENDFVTLLDSDEATTYQNACFNSSTLLSVKESFNIAVGPNPSSEIINITSLNDRLVDKVELYNEFGELSLKTFKTGTIDISKLKPGVYFLKGYSNEELITKKLIVK